MQGHKIEIEFNRLERELVCIGRACVALPFFCRNQLTKNKMARGGVS